ncbi:nitroreductase [Ectopseudomonas mendocina]|uniref:nitroreductase n=1 Tax=Ectopseudomonas mendocina TaxID=300 RepID=UPI00117992E4|nr:nitroreductase [Pseudomonas mendocina]TRO06718.1 nitroreductase [Pseudomonas mendocina]
MSSEERKELALKTYSIIKKRRVAKARKKERDINDFKIKRIIKQNRRNNER